MKTSKFIMFILSAFGLIVILDNIFNLAEWQVVVILLLYCLPWMVKDFQEDLKKMEKK
jgi:predicted membrane protein